MSFKSSILSPLAHLFYPHVCAGCGSDIVQQDNFICLQCINDLPHTNFAMHGSNAVEKIFWGRLPITAAMSEFYFTKGTIIQNLIHEFKYKGNGGEYFVLNLKGYFLSIITLGIYMFWWLILRI